MMNQRKLIQLMVGGFPFLLALAVVGGLVFYYMGPSDFGMVGERSDAGQELVRAVPLSEEAVAANLRIFSEVLGGRDTGEREGQSRAGKYLDSTLGVRNTGYLVRRPFAGIEGIGWSLLEMDIKGGRKPEEIVIVNGSFDTLEDGEDSSGVAVLLSVARAMAGATPERTIRFVFDTGDESVRNRYSAMLREESVKIVEFIEIGRSVAGEISVGEAEGYKGLGGGKRRLISGSGGGGAAPRELVEVAKQIKTTILLAGRSQQ